MLEIPSAISNLGLTAVALFLFVAAIWLILKIIQAIKGGFRNGPHPHSAATEKPRTPCAYLEPMIINRQLTHEVHEGLKNQQALLQSLNHETRRTADSNVRQEQILSRLLESMNRR